MAKDPIKKAENGTYYFRANLGFHPITGKQIQNTKADSRQKRKPEKHIQSLCLHPQRN